MSIFNFNNEVLLPNTLYYITLETTRANSTGNYVNLQKSSANQYASGSNFYVTSVGAYVDTSSDLLFTIICGDGTPGSVIKTTSGSGFLGFAKKSVGSIPNNTNVAVAGILVNMAFENETTAVSSTNDINQTSTANGVFQTIYSGTSSQLNGFLSGPRADNLEKITVYVTQNGTGGGVLTCSVYKWATDYYGPTLQKGDLVGSVAITTPTNGADNVFTFSSPMIPIQTLGIT